MLKSLFLTAFCLQNVESIPSPPPFVTDVPENAWIGLLFIVFSIVFVPLIFYLGYIRCQMTLNKLNVQKITNSSNENRQKPVVKHIKNNKHAKTWANVWALKGWGQS